MPAGGPPDYYVYVAEFRRPTAEHFRWSATFQAPDDRAARAKARELLDSMYRRAGCDSVRVFRQIDDR
jgi:hypothetical protein